MAEFKGMKFPSSVTVEGREWKLFSVTFKSPDGKFSAYYYAIDAEHASYQLEAMRETAEVCDISVA